MSEIKFSSRLLGRFVETTAAELGREQFNAVLVLAGLPAEWNNPGTLAKMGEVEAARVYALLQAAVRSYYGRGARGILLRVGSRLWDCLLEDASLGVRAQALFIKGLPVALRRKSTLELLGRLLSAKLGDITVHTLDLDLLFVDRASPAAEGQSDAFPICFVTSGLIREALHWAADEEYDVEETSCRARGQNECEFKIVVGT